MFNIHKIQATLFVAAALFVIPHFYVQAFCGFYVAQADASLFNDASRVVVVRVENRTVITMENDYSGALREFAMVIPVPTVLEEDDIRVRETSLIDRVDSYSAPRLVEYHDPDPCNMIAMDEVIALSSVKKETLSGGSGFSVRGNRHRVTIEAEYDIEEYDILILSAEDSEGLVLWLQENDYKIPDGAEKVLGSYIKQDMRFFVAKVNLEKQAALEQLKLRPLQVEFRTDKFMLPIRLGTVNARGDQDLLVYLLTANGRVETANYRTIKLPTGQEIPTYIKSEFKDFYRAMFSHQHELHGGRVVFNEYTWNSGWCDPCAGSPLTPGELELLGYPLASAPAPIVTRLHLRYNASTFPEDLIFAETADKQNFQGRYVLRHPWTGYPEECSAALSYFEDLERRREDEAQTLADLTGWKLWEIRQKYGLGDNGGNDAADENWWESVKSWFGRGE